VRLTAAISHEGVWHVARCLEVEVTSQGETVDESLANLREALELYFEDEAPPGNLEPPSASSSSLSIGNWRPARSGQCSGRQD